uniref:Farnesoic acid O-methyl transferase domain-containing protein n=1 Tax=Megaselia scalaris TaxID=36166 RepID=T1GFU4_MEGSC
PFGKCENEVLIKGNGKESYSKFQKFISLEEFQSNDDVIQLRFYFQGKSDFSVALSASSKEQDKDEQFFKTLIAFGENETISFKKNNNNIFCDQKSNIPNPFDTFYFEKLDLTLNMKIGYMMWFLPGRSAPFLSCYHSNIANMKFLAFSTWNQNQVRYIFNCDN